MRRPSPSLQTILCGVWVFALSLTFGGASSAVAQCLVPPEGLVSWWSGNGSTIDGQGSNDGVLQGGAGYTSGHVVQAFQFGGDGDYVVAPDAGLPSGGESRSIEFWMQTIETRQRTILGYRTGDASQAGLALRIGLQEGRVMVTQLGDTIRSSTPINDGAFHHVAIVVEGESETVTIYLDGVLDQTATLRSDTQLSGRFIIGADEQAQGSIEGVVDELSVYNRALPAADIEAIVRVGAAGKCKTVNGVVRGTNLALIQCHNLTTGRSVVIPAAAELTMWNCTESGLVINPGDWIYQELIGLAN